MAGDRARVSFDPSRKWRGLVAQQGRVSVEADWNEAATIAAESDRLTTLDVVGPEGTPDGGYSVTPAAAGDLTIGPGTLYVGGERLDLDAAVTYGAQPDWLDHSTDPLWAAAAVPSGPGPSYELVYLLAAEQEVSAVEDPALADVALGGPDTMQRQCILQRFVRQQSQSPICGSAWDAFTSTLGVNGQRFDPGSMMIASAAALRVSFVSTDTTPSLCQPAASGGYLGAENQMIRVMITSADGAAAPTIVWGFDDASFLYRITSAVPNADGTTTLTFAAAPPDSYHYPQDGQAVELLRDAVQLTPPVPAAVPPYPGDYIAAQTGVVASAVGPYDPVQGQLVISGALPDDYLNTSTTPQLYLRVWQGTATVTPGQAVTLGETGVAVTLTSSTNTFHHGDFWRFALRPIQPAIVYPARYLDAPQPPDGPRTWACPLAMLTWTDGSGTAMSCVPSFHNLVQLTQRGGCCTVDISPADVGGGIALQALIDGYANEGPVTVCLEPGIYTLPAPLMLGPGHAGLTLQACRGGVTFQADQSSPAFAAGLIVVEDASLVTIRGIELTVPLAVFTPPTGSFAAFPPANQALLTEYGRSLRVAIGIWCADATGLTVEDCAFNLRDLNENIFGAGIFATGVIDDVTVRGCAFGVTDPPASFPYYYLIGENARKPPFQLTFGYLQLPAPAAAGQQVMAGQYLDNATFERCSFEGLTVAALAMTPAGAIRVARNTVSDCYGGYWLFSFTDPALIAALDTLAIGDPEVFARLSAAGAAPILDRVWVLASAIGQLLLAAQARDASVVRHGVAVPDPAVLSRAARLAAHIVGAPAARPQVAAPTPGAGALSMRLDFADCEVDTAIASSYSGAGLVLFDFAQDAGLALVHDNRITDRFLLGEAVVLWGLGQACVTGNVIANQVPPQGGDNGQSRSIVVTAMAEPFGVTAVAITGNVFIDPTHLPQRPATLPAVLTDWDVLNTVIDYVAPSAVSGISPSHGAAGTTVTINGTGFTGVTGVTFGMTAAASFTFVNDTQVTAVAPAGSGTVDVIVTNPAGTSATSQQDQFTYDPPTVQNVDPRSGTPGTSVRVTGTGFTDVTGVTFGMTAATSFTFVNDTEVTAVAPFGFGPVDIRVTTPAGTSAVTAADQFQLELEVI